MQYKNTIIPIIALCFFLSLTVNQAYAQDKETLYCLGFEWDIPEEDLVECASQQASGLIQLNPRFKKIAQGKLSSNKTLPPHNNTRSSRLFGVVIKAQGQRYGSAYFKADGSGYRAVFHDNGPDYFKNGVSRYIANSKMGFINKTGDVVIPAQFTFVSPFQDGYARYCEDCEEKMQGEHAYISSKHWQFIDKKSNTLIPPVLAPMVITRPQNRSASAEVCQTFCNTPIEREFLKSLCQQKNKAACTDYGKLLGELFLSEWALGNADVEFSDAIYSSYRNFEGTGDSKTLKLTTRAFLNKSCHQHNNKENCGVLGIIEYGENNPQLSQNLLTMACNDLVAWACNNLGYINDLSFNHTMAQKLYQKACDLGNDIACFNNGTSEYRLSKHGKAAIIFRKSCGNGFEVACNTLKSTP